MSLSSEESRRPSSVRLPRWEGFGGVLLAELGEHVVWSLGAVQGRDEMKTGNEAKGQVSQCALPVE